MPTSKEETIYRQSRQGLQDIISFTLGNLGQNKAFPLEFLQNCVTPTGKKPRSLEITHDFFLITIINLF